VKGFLSEFGAIAHKNSEYLNQLADLNIPIVGIEPSIVLTYRDEYQKIIPTSNNPLSSYCKNS
jgi:Fe-S oxidoreductase